ncbi:hypothetical protein UFOVP144_40 [uncultured Caudovirales phage]|uniref:Uncharacterized protein n=1 Tax=uncultured Caudovirales phage TaxID=2100421 RepID=A0A6J7XR82_9CAUD|nr:hypothetical protein UFOVP144_40 [uncultured Caudovirales phage]
MNKQRQKNIETAAHQIVQTIKTHRGYNPTEIGNAFAVEIMKQFPKIVIEDDLGSECLQIILAVALRKLEEEYPSNIV